MTGQVCVDDWQLDKTIRRLDIDEGVTKIKGRKTRKRSTSTVVVYQDRGKEEQRL